MPPDSRHLKGFPVLGPPGRRPMAQVMSNTTTSFKSRAASLISAGTAEPPKSTTKRSPYAAQAGEQRGVQTSPSTVDHVFALRNVVHCPAGIAAYAAADSDRGADAANEDGLALRSSTPRGRRRATPGAPTPPTRRGLPRPRAVASAAARRRATTSTSPGPRRGAPTPRRWRRARPPGFPGASA